ncbi:RecT family [uncultured Caudovirales phage]|uniref:RecT family n=1 Tax=uncultured Caudovirales phage TaxID=2100421 RepID=A0A6J5NH80_9CAUD|nr:RecT family [uncultured Caudovirales phage]
MSNEITTTEDVQIARENAAFEMLQRQAKMFSASTLVPKDFQGNIANCAIAINIAKRLGTDPFMTIQNVDIIHGRPSFRATFLIAMVNSAGRFEPLQFKMEGEEGKPSRSCVAWTKSKPEGTPLEGPKITLEMAKAEGWSTKNGSKWQTMPELMLRYRAAAFFARLYAPDITLGMMTAEEVTDTVERDVTPRAESSLFKTLAAKSPQTALPPEVGEKTGNQNRSAESLFEVESVTLLDQVKGKLIASGFRWGQVLTKLQESGIGREEFTPLEVSDDDTLKSALELWAGIEAALKKEGN